MNASGPEGPSMEDTNEKREAKEKSVEDRVEDSSVPSLVPTRPLTRTFPHVLRRRPFLSISLTVRSSIYYLRSFFLSFCSGAHEKKKT